MRSYHWLKRSRNVGFPKRQLSLTVSWERVLRARSRTVADDVLTAWNAIEWSGGPGQENYEASGSGYEADTFWRFVKGLMRRRTCLWVWCHGMAHALTILGFWRGVSDGRFVLSRDDEGAVSPAPDGRKAPSAALVVVNDPPTIILATIPGMGGSLRLLDLRNLGDCEGPGANGGRRSAADQATFLHGWSRAVDQLNLGGLRHTAAAQAWHGWRHSYMGCGVLVHGNAEVSRLERAGVHPGRAETYRLGVVGGPVHCLDASSHYPSCAIAGPLPVRLRWCGACTLADVRGAVSRGWLAICECRVRCAAPLLPCRIDTKGRPIGSGAHVRADGRAGPSADRTVWPTGDWTVVLPWPEVERSLSGGAEVSVLRAAVYEPGRPLDRFVSALWDARQSFQREGRGAESAAVKLILNSLIGKWASRGHVWGEAPEGLAPSDWHTWYAPYGEEGLLHRYRSIGWHVQREDDEPETPESIPALAAWTYSVGRVRLLDWIETAQWGDVHYVDSDSLFVSAIGAERLVRSGVVRPGSLGALRLQGVYPEIRIGGIRDYRAGSRTVCAGVPKAETTELNGVRQWWQESTVREAVDRHAQPSGRAALVSVPVARAYRHGVVDSDGRISPLNVFET